MGAIEYQYPQGIKNIPRSYLPGVIVSSDYSVEPFWDGQVIQWTSAAGYIYRLAISDFFYPWSSNVYSFDYMVDETGSSIDCVLFPCFDVCYVTLDHYLNDGKPGLRLQPLATLAQERFMALPPSPTDWWIQFGA